MLFSYLFHERQDTVSDIVKTYNLTPKLADKVTRIATANIEKYGITDFDDQYRYLTELVERFTQPYRERRFRRMDSPVGDYKRPLHEIIGAEDPHLTGLFDEQEPERQSLSGQEVIECLSGRLDTYDIRVLMKLVESGQIEQLTPNETRLILAYEDVDGDPDEAARHSEYNASTFIRHRTGAGLKIRPRGSSQAE